MTKRISNNTKSKVCKFRVTDEELQKIKDYSSHIGVNRSEFLRMLVNNFDGSFGENQEMWPQTDETMINDDEEMWPQTDELEEFDDYFPR